MFPWALGSELNWEVELVRVVLVRVRSKDAGNCRVFEPLRQHPAQNHTHPEGTLSRKRNCRFTGFEKATSLTCNLFIAFGLSRQRQFNLPIKFRP